MAKRLVHSHRVLTMKLILDERFVGVRRSIIQKQAHKSVCWIKRLYELFERKI